MIQVPEEVLVSLFDSAVDILTGITEVLDKISYKLETESISIIDCLGVKSSAFDEIKALFDSLGKGIFGSNE